MDDRCSLTVSKFCKSLSHSFFSASLLLLSTDLFLAGLFMYSTLGFGMHSDLWAALCKLFICCCRYSVFLQSKNGPITVTMVQDAKSESIALDPLLFDDDHKGIYTLLRNSLRFRSFLSLDFKNLVMNIPRTIIYSQLKKNDHHVWHTFN